MRHLTVIEQKDGRRIWVLGMEENELYDLICDRVAWQLVRVGHEKDCVREIVSKTIDTVQGFAEKNDKPEEIGDKWLSLIFSERKRLGLGKFGPWKGEKKDESEST